MSVSFQRVAGVTATLATLVFASTLQADSDRLTADDSAAIEALMETFLTPTMLTNTVAREDLAGSLQCNGGWLEKLQTRSDINALSLPPEMASITLESAAFIDGAAYQVKTGETFGLFSDSPHAERYGVHSCEVQRPLVFAIALADIELTVPDNAGGKKREKDTPCAAFVRVDGRWMFWQDRFPEPIATNVGTRCSTLHREVRETARRQREQAKAAERAAAAEQRQQACLQKPRPCIESDSRAILGALDIYRLDTFDYPSRSQGLSALVKDPGGVNNWNGPYLGSVPKDPWGRPYIFKQTGKYEHQVGSYGQDGKPGGRGSSQDIFLSN